MRELYDLSHSAPVIIQVIKSRIRWAGQGKYGRQERCIQDLGGET
jgi:hypothetical protein